VQLRQIDVIRLRDTLLRLSPSRRPETRKCACHVLALNLALLRAPFVLVLRSTGAERGTRNEERFGHAEHEERERERERSFYFPCRRIRIVSDPTVKRARAALFTLFFIALLMASSAQRAISFLCLPRLSPPRFYDPGSEGRVPSNSGIRAKSTAARCENDPRKLKKKERAIASTRSCRASFPSFFFMRPSF